MTTAEAIEFLENVITEAHLGIGLLQCQPLRRSSLDIPNGIVILGDYVIIKRTPFHSLRSEKTSVLDPAEPTVAP